MTADRPTSGFLDAAAADLEAKRRNQELGASGPTNDYFIAAEADDGRWVVQRRTTPPEGMLRTLWKNLASPWYGG